MPPGDDAEGTVWVMARDCLPEALTNWPHAGPCFLDSEIRLCPQQERIHFFLLEQSHHSNITRLTKIQHARLCLVNQKYISLDKTSAERGLRRNSSTIRKLRGENGIRTKEISRIQSLMERAEVAGCAHLPLAQSRSGPDPTSATWGCVCSCAMLGWTLPTLVSSSPFLCFYYWPASCRYGQICFLYVT